MNFYDAGYDSGMAATFPESIIEEYDVEGVLNKSEPVCAVIQKGGCVLRGATFEVRSHFPVVNFCKNDNIVI